jgi:hypothetical protein
MCSSLKIIILFCCHHVQISLIMSGQTQWHFSYKDVTKCIVVSDYMVKCTLCNIAPKHWTDGIEQLILFLFIKISYRYQSANLEMDDWRMWRHEWFSLVIALKICIISRSEKRAIKGMFMTKITRPSNQLIMNVSVQ